MAKPWPAWSEKVVLFENEGMTQQVQDHLPMQVHGPEFKSLTRGKADVTACAPVHIVKDRGRRCWPPPVY